MNVTAKVGDDDLALHARVTRRAPAGKDACDTVRGDFGFKHDNAFVGYRHEQDLGEKGGMRTSMGAAKFKHNEFLFFARSDIVNKFLNAGLEYTHKNFTWTVENFFGLEHEKVADGQTQPAHEGFAMINQNFWLKSCLTSKFGPNSDFKQRINLGGVGTGGSWNTYHEIKHKINDNVTAGFNHKYHSKHHGSDKGTDIGMTLNYKI